MFWHKQPDHIFLCTSSNFGSEIFFCPDFYRNNFLYVINQQIHFATAPLRSFWILWICHCCQAVCVAYAYHTIQQAELSNRAIIIFFTSWKVKKNISYGYQIYQKMSVKRLRIFYCFEIWNLYFLWVQRFWNWKGGVGRFHRQADFRYRSDI